MTATSSESTAKNLIRIDLSSNSSLKDYFSRLPDGHVCRLEIEFSKTGMTDGAVEGSVSSIAPEDYEEPLSKEEKPGGEVETSGEKPVMVSVGAPPSGGGY